MMMISRETLCLEIYVEAGQTLDVFLQTYIGIISV